MELKRKDGHRKEKERWTQPQVEYENPARFFGTERRKPAQKPTPTSPTHRFWKNLKERSHSLGDTCSLQDFDILQMPFRFGSFGLLSKLEMYKTPLTDCSTVHTVSFRHLETRPMPFRFGSFGLLSKLEMYKTPLTDCSTVHTVGFRHLETRPVVSIFRFQRSKRSPRSSATAPKHWTAI
ncbi:hypothetical protein V1477_010021 [Vespula maculifrons]|uniref:Uncharacterized protein n=1 Tax=Vespula maculifrons TaxID=7453 RepID=A0ABD2CBF0_VESMC